MDVSAVPAGAASGRGRRRTLLTACALACALTPALVGSSAASAATNLYVSPTGNDVTGTGSARAPWASVDRARAQIRARGLNANMTDDVIVNVAPGTYSTSRTIEFTDADSGSNGHNVIYRASGAPGSARITGGRRITGWQQYSGNIYRVNVGSWRFHTLYENGKRTTAARYPNLVVDPRLPMARAPYLRAEGVLNSKWELQYRAGDVDPTRLGDLSDAKLFYWPGGKWSWFTDLNPVRSVDPANRIFNLTNQARYNIFQSNQGARWMIQDALALLDQPGEHYLDTRTGWLYYMARDGAIGQQTIVAPQVKRLVSFVGASPSQRVHDVELRGLTLDTTDFTGSYRHAHVDDNDSGENHLYPGYDRQIELPEHRQGMVYLENSRDIAIRDSHLFNAGYSAIYMILANERNTVSGNWIERAGHSGVVIQGGYPGEGDVSHDNVVTNNLIDRVGELVGSGSGVYFLNSGGNELSYTEISNATRYGVDVLTYTDIPGADVYTRGNRVHHVAIRDVAQDSGDVGALNSFGLSEGAPYNTNYYDQITIRGVRAHPSMPDIAPDGVFMDADTQGQWLHDIEVSDVQGTLKRDNNRDPNPPNHSEVNVSWLPGFDASRMDYANIGVRSSFVYASAPCADGRHGHGRGKGHGHGRGRGHGAKTGG